MSRYSERDDYDDYDDDETPEDRAQAWDCKVRAALRSEQGRAHLAAIRDALLALPVKRLISGALCTVGGVDARLPAISEAERAAIEAKEAAFRAEMNIDLGPDWPRKMARMEQSCREDDREKLADVIGENGGAEGVCLVGAYLWHRKVTLDGATPDEAFAALPAVFGGEDGEDPLIETAELGKQAGLSYEVAWELAYLNDETFGDKTPEQRYAAFLAWIDAELAEPAAA
jgi:hypothetical protein